MAQRKPPYGVEITEGAIRVTRAPYILTIRPSASLPDAEEAADFVVSLEDVEHWDAPHGDVEIDITELQAILRAIEIECDRHGLSVEFE